MSEKELEKQLDHSLKWAREVVLHGGYDEQTRNAVVGTIESARFYVAASEAALALQHIAHINADLAEARDDCQHLKMLRDNALAELAGAKSALELIANGSKTLPHLTADPWSKGVAEAALKEIK